MEALRVLGIDPGTRVVGWGVLEGDGGGEPAYVGSGVLELGRSSAALPDRLLRLRHGLLELIEMHRPDLLALESAFFGKNARSALRLGEARGTVIVTSCELKVTLRELAPALVKRRVAGAGAATKEQVARLVKLRLPGTGDFGSEDESDALAVALCAWLEEQETHLRNGQDAAAAAAGRVSEQ